MQFVKRIPCWPIVFLGITYSIFPTCSLAQTSGPADWEPKTLWEADLPPEITGASFFTETTGEATFFVCANKKLFALSSNGKPLKEFRGSSEPLNRLIPVKPPQGRVAFLGYSIDGLQLLFLDRGGKVIGKHQLAESKENGIDAVAVAPRKLLVGFDGEPALKMYNLDTDGDLPQLNAVWDDPEEVYCNNVAFGQFGNHFVAAIDGRGGRLDFLTADRKQRISRDFGYLWDLETVPLSANTSAVAAIFNVSSDNEEELILLNTEKILFRARIGKRGEKISWRTQRIVAGRFLQNDLPEVAVLRGDGSVVVFDQTGQPVNMLPANDKRTAIELGHPYDGRDTLLGCETDRLCRYAFPKSMPQEIAEERAVVKNPNAEFLKIRETDTASDLWARALWLSLPMNDATSEEIAGLFIAALSRVNGKEKAPIYVSFGRTDSGPHHFKELFNRTMTTLETEAAAALAKEIERQDKKQLLKDAQDKDPVAEKALIEMLHSAQQKAAASENFHNDIEALVKATTEGTTASERYYLAAIAEEPNYLPARYFLAMESEGELHEKAVASLIEHDPENAFGYYLRAIIELDKEGDLATVLKTVQTGNSKKVCRVYESPLPRNFKANYPDQEDYRKLGIAGEAMHPKGLANFVRANENLWSWADRNEKQRREMVYKLREEGMCLCQSGNADEGLSYLFATRDMGLRLMQVESRDSLVIVHGLGYASGVYYDLKSAYEALQDKDGLKQLEQARNQLEKFREDFGRAIDAGKPAEKSIPDILRGKTDPLGDVRRNLDKALRDNGFLPPLEKPAK